MAASKRPRDDDSEGPDAKRPKLALDARVLVACEFSGAVRDAFRALGVEAWSCDLRASDSPFHVQGDVFDVVARAQMGGHLKLVIVHPPCTYLCSSGLHWNRRVPGRAAKTAEALVFVRKLLALDVPMLALENPVGCIGTEIRRADQYVQPYEYGDDASKRTGLWLRGLPLLVADPTQRVAGRITKDGKERWANQTDSGQNRLGPSANREAVRSITYPGIAAAMAAQWATLVLRE